MGVDADRCDMYRWEDKQFPHPQYPALGWVVQSQLHFVSYQRDRMLADLEFVIAKCVSNVREKRSELG